ncbi:hypothetical protein FisN_16Hh189 [Fistulifera solaris]|uniref:EGF-like domain-containing protein n=1 Tax=Fistulifera solaris TaxID=1519565 RepID=A0A1Z5KTG3_FISSO|nr:hypothetical protein FisN_16Hh189 [Fistulifera solaris]|eukprot:GAX29372.1 hypothetical protein FisN_16Hh189 [Fistulifera solaris]
MLRLFVFALLPHFATAWGKEKCTLHCQNGGVCKETMTEIHTGGDFSDVHEYAPARKFYCHCPLYHAGPECEVQFDECPGPGNSTMCANGAKCVRDIGYDGDAYYHCGCNTETTDYASAYARRTCKRMSTVFCLPDDAEKSLEIQQSLGQAGGAYCMNGGRCKSMDPEEVKRHPGCECPTGWSGLHCEYPESDALKAKFHYGEQNKETAGTLEESSNSPNFFITVAWICLIVVLAMVGGIGFAVWDGYRETTRTRRRRLEKATRIPAQISAKIKAKKKSGLQPMEIEEF